jgi:hypothetical protein
MSICIRAKFSEASQLTKRNKNELTNGESLTWLPRGSTFLHVLVEKIFDLERVDELQCVALLKVCRLK